MQQGAMSTVLGASRTMNAAEDYKERANQNAARDRRNRNPNTPNEQFVMPGQQQMQAQMQAGARRFQGQPMTFANMQKQGVARPAPPPPPGAVQTRTAQFQPRGQMAAPTVDRVQQALNQPVQFDERQRQFIEQELAARMQMNQQQTAPVRSQVEFIPQEPLPPAQRPQPIRAATPEPQYSTRDRILMSLGREPVDAPNRQQALENARAEFAGGQPNVEPAPGAAGTATRMATPRPVLTQGQPAAPAPTPATPAPATPAPVAPAAPAAQPTVADQVRDRLGKGPGAPKGGEVAPQPPAQPQAPVAEPQQPAAQPQQPQATTQQDLQDVLRQQLMGLVEAPSAYQSEDIQQMREAQRADIEAQFSAQRQALEEDLARRGLSASSIAAGQFGDLAGQQARAIATAEAGLTKEAADALQRGRETAIQGLAQAAGISLEERGLDLQSKKVQADIDSEAKRLMQQDRSLDLQQARDRATASIQRAQLAEQAAQRVSNENLTIAKMNQQESQFARTFGLDQDRLQSDINYRAEQIRLQDRTINETVAHNMASEQIQRDTLNQRVAEAQAAADRFGLEFETDQERWNWTQNWIMQQAEAAGGPAPEIPDIGAALNSRLGSGAGRGPNDQGFE